MKLDFYRCPLCRAGLAQDDEKVICTGCGRRYPIWNGIPVLLISERSLFDSPLAADHSVTPSWKRLARALIPRMGHNLSARRMYPKFCEILTREVRVGRPRVVLIGAGGGGIGIEALTKNSDIDLVRLDVAPRGALDVIADAHDLPFEDGSCDAVVIQAVLEHVLDPNRVVAEVYRVLRERGIVYAETPFMQMVHERAFDFTRFTDLGHRYLFRQFAEIERGLTGGPGMTLLWAWAYFLRAFFRGPLAADIAVTIARLTGFWLLWIDHLVARKPGAYDACSGIFFLGRKEQTALAIVPRELVTSFRGI